MCVAAAAERAKLPVCDPPGSFRQGTPHAATGHRRNARLLCAAVQVVVNQIIVDEQLSRHRRGQLLKLVKKLIRMQRVDVGKSFVARSAFRPHPAPTCNFACNKDGSVAVTASYDNTCRVWNTAEAAKLRSLEGHTNVVFSVAFNNPFGKLVVTGSFDRSARLWNPHTGDCLGVMEGHTGELVKVMFSPDGRQVATASMDRTVRLWDAETSKPIATFAGHSAPVSCIVFDADGTNLLSGSCDATVRQWDPRVAGSDGSGGGGDEGASRSVASVREYKGHSRDIAGLDINFTNDTVLSGSADNTVRLWDSGSGRCRTVVESHADEVTGVCFNPQGNRAASSSADGCVLMMQTLTGRVESRLLGHGGGVSSVCFNPQGSQLASTGVDGTTRLWDVETGTLRETLAGHTEEVYAAQFSYDGDLLMTGSLDWTCRVWGLVDSAEEAPPMMTRPGTALPGAMRSGGWGAFGADPATGGAGGAAVEVGGGVSGGAAASSSGAWETGTGVRAAGYRPHVYAPPDARSTSPELKLHR